MTAIMKSDIFFFISSVGFIIIGLTLVIFLIYTIKAVRSFNSLVEKMESEINNLGDTASDLVDDIRTSFVYKMLFNPKRKRTLPDRK